MSCNKMQINSLKFIQCDCLDFCFRFRLSQLKCTFDKNYRPLHALYFGKPAKSAVYQIVVLPTVDTFVPVSSNIFTRSFAVVLGLICTYRTKVRSSLGDRTRLHPELYDSCMVPLCLYLRTIVCTDKCGTFRHLKLLPRMNQTCGGLQFVLVYVKF